MDVIASIDRARAEINVLEHPFYERWSAGELGAAELGRYAGEYSHAVIALAHASALAAEHAPPTRAPALKGHAGEEAAHVGLWEAFARAAGAEDGAEDPGPLTETALCARAWTAGEDLLEHLAVLYAIEAGQPEISLTKLEGLVTYYGYHPDGPALEYFRVHAVRDLVHAREVRELIGALLADADNGGRCEVSMVDRARAALHGNWRLLDGVEAAAGVA